MVRRSHKESGLRARELLNALREALNDSYSDDSREQRLVDAIRWQKLTIDPTGRSSYRRNP